MKRHDKIICTKQHKVYKKRWKVGVIYKSLGEPYVIEGKDYIEIELNENSYDFGNPNFFKVVEEEK